MINYLRDTEGLADDIKSNLTTTELVKKYGICDRTIRKLRTRLKNSANNTDGVVNTNGTVNTNSEDSQVSFNETNGERNYTIVTHKRVKTLDDLYDLTQLDRFEWEIPTFQCKVYEGFYRNKTIDNAVVVQMFSVSCKAKRVQYASAVKVEFEKLADELNQRAKQLPTVPKLYTPKLYKPTELLYLVEPNDPHFNKFCWGKETGYEDYDLKLAESAFDEGMEYLANANQHIQFDRVQLVFGNDLVNADNKTNTTTAGTPQDCDSRYQKTFSTVVKCLRRAIDMYRQITPQLDVRFIVGNHDTLTTFCISQVITTAYENVEGVRVFSEPRVYSFDRHGNVGFMFHHGNDIKSTEYPLIFARDCPKVFSECWFKEIHLGHLHKDKSFSTVDETHGVKIRISPSISPADAWHSSKGFTGNLRSIVGRTYSKERGYIGENMFTMQPPTNRLIEDSSLTY